jgi:predicted MPP superfamily phosphohydrolase
LEQIETEHYPVAEREQAARPRWEDTLYELFYLPVRVVARLPLLTTKAYEEARSISITQTSIGMRQWPSALDGMRVAFLSDMHASPQTPCDFIERVVDETNRLQPDLILLGGDYVTRGTEYIRPMAEVLGRLRAPLGVFAVMGNHDYRAGPALIRSALKQVGIVDVTNSGRWLRLDGSRLRIAGVGDLWHDQQDLKTALSGVTDNDPVILLSHNPDYAMRLTDRRVDLVLSGHTHGGQIRLPGVGPLITNSKYGTRLLNGLVTLDSLQLYVTRGVGTVVVPLRYGSPPEIALLTLRRSEL